MERRNFNDKNMRVKYVSIRDDLVSLNKTDLAKSLYRTLLYQHETAQTDVINASAVYDASLAANQAAEREHKKPENFTGGFSPALPFSDGMLARQSQEVERLVENMQVHRAMLNFVVDELIDKYLGNVKE